ncbi:unnamed protein product [Caenorhabditis nigoni]
MLEGQKFMFSSKDPVLYFEDLRMGTTMIVNYVADLFNLDVFGIVIDGNGIWAIDWINNRQEKMLGSIDLSTNIYYDSNCDETVDYVLRNARISHYCKIYHDVSNNFKFNGKLGPLRRLIVRSYGHWVTLENLMNFDSHSILITGSRLSLSDFNSFLRHWRAGGSPRLEWLHLIFEVHSFRERFDEDLEVVKTDEVRLFRRSHDEGEWIFRGGYSIQRTDGAKAMIKCGTGWFLMGVWH